MTKTDMLRPALVLGFAGLLAACGSSAKTTAATTATTATTTAAAAGTQEPTTAVAATQAPTTAPAASSAATTVASTGTAASATAGAGDATTVAVTETEFKIDGVTTTMKAGTYTFDVSNAGKFKHNLTVDGPGVSGVTSDTLSGGASGKLTVTLKPGTYDFYCSIPTHKAKGMDMTITVT